MRGLEILVSLVQPVDQVVDRRHVLHRLGQRALQLGPQAVILGGQFVSIHGAYVRQRTDRQYAPGVCSGDEVGRADASARGLARPTVLRRLATAAEPRAKRW